MLNHIHVVNNMFTHYTNLDIKKQSKHLVSVLRALKRLSKEMEKANS